MKLIPFLEAVEDYRLKKNLKKVEKKIALLEATAATQVAHIFRQQGEIINQSLPEEFNEHDLTRAADKAELETYPAFKDVIVGTGLVAAKVGIRGLLIDLNLQEGEAGFTGYKISFDEFDEAAHRRLQEVAGSKITRINEETRKQIHEILADGFKGELQPDGTTKYKSYQQIAKDIKDRFEDFAAAAPQKHIRNRAELVAITEIRDAYETSKHETSKTLEDHGWELEKHWNNMGDSRVSDGCRSNTAAGWIDNNASFPSGHQYSPRFPGCRCNVTRRVKKRKEQSGLPADRWIVTRKGDKVTVKRNPKYH